MSDVFMEPGIPLDRPPRTTEPLSTQLELTFEPSTLPSHVPFREDMKDTFVEELEKSFGAGLVPKPSYRSSDLRRLAEQGGKAGIEALDLQALTPEGFVLEPAGRLSLTTPPTVLNRIRCGNFRIIINARGTTEGCEQAAKAVIIALDKSSGDNKGWKYYSDRIVRRGYGTQTSVEMPTSLRGFIAGSPLEKVLEEIVEGELAARMGPQKLDFDHYDEEDVGDRSVVITSHLDYASHMKLVEALRKVLKSS